MFGLFGRLGLAGPDEEGGYLVERESEVGVMREVNRTERAAWSEKRS